MNVNTFNTRTVKTAAIAGILLAAPLLLTGCAGSAEPTDKAKTEQTDTKSHDAHQAGEDATTLVEGWAKAAKKGGMTGLFGNLENHGKTDLTITSVESDAAGMIELHEVTAAGVMQEISTPVVVPAGGALELAPGANHIMLMDLKQDLLAGDEVTITVNYDDGSSAKFTVLVKDYTGANEEYGSDSEHDMSGMDHGTETGGEDHSSH